MSQRKWPIYIGVIALCVLFIITISSLRSRSARGWEFPEHYYVPMSDTDAAQIAPLLGKPMPPLTLSNWQNGQVDLASLGGKVVVVDFWATWCGPCIAEMPHTSAMAAKYKEQGVVTIGICSSQGQDAMEETIKSTGATYPIAGDVALKTENDWKILFFPTYGVIDKKGNLRALGLMPDAVEKVVQKLLAEPA